MKKIIIVDDNEPSKATVAYWLKQEIYELTNGKYGAELLEGVIISEALPQVKELAKRIHNQNETVVGLLVDLVDKGVADAGVLLLDKVKSDPELKKVPVVIYTSKQMGCSVADLHRCGAKAFVKRKANWVEEILSEFGIPYTSSRTGSTGPS